MILGGINGMIRLLFNYMFQKNNFYSLDRSNFNQFVFALFFMGILILSLYLSTNFVDNFPSIFVNDSFEKITSPDNNIFK